MPFKIIKSDITKITADVIEHITLPTWMDGEHEEFDILERDCTKALVKALELGYESIAFPLVLTEEDEFPADIAIQIAVSTFRKFLLKNEMQIILVVSDKTSFQLPSQIVGDIDSYINANYVKQKRNRECTRHFRKELIESDTQFEWSEDTAEMMEPMIQTLPMSIQYELDNVGVSFHNKLFELIEQSGIDNKDVWKLANLDRKHFSKIQCNEKYHPKKKTVMALCIALQLDLDESKDLLARADWAFSPSRKVDLIVQKAIEDKQYDIFQLNTILFKYTNETLGL